MKLLFVVGLLLAIPAVAQLEKTTPEQPPEALITAAFPEAPSVLWAQPIMPVAPVIKTNPVPEAPSHVFLDRPAKIRFAILAGLIAADGITTQHVLNADGGKEVNPLARPFVTHGAAGQLAASALGYAVGVGGSYLFHRTGHHKLERFFQNAAIGVEAECFTDNLVQSALTNRSGK
jgi:hypothetical protein